MTKSILITIATALLLMGCVTGADDRANNRFRPLPEPKSSLGNVEFYTHKLAIELFSQTRPANQAKYAVVGFVPLPELQFNDALHHPLQLLGHQLKEGLITEAAKRGYGTQEFLLSDDIKVSEMADSVLTRDVDELSAVHDIDFFITGTVLQQEKGAMVNARIIHVNSKEIVAAATTFFPADLFWQSEGVTMRNGRLLRQQSAKHE